MSFFFKKKETDHFLELFRGFMQQDAHEFLNYLLNEVAEILQKLKKDKEGSEQNKQNEESQASKKEEEEKNGYGDKQIEEEEGEETKESVKKSDKTSAGELQKINKPHFFSFNFFLFEKTRRKNICP